MGSHTIDRAHLRVRGLACLMIGCVLAFGFVAVTATFGYPYAIYNETSPELVSGHQVMYWERGFFDELFVDPLEDADPSLPAFEDPPAWIEAVLAEPVPADHARFATAVGWPVRMLVGYSVGAPLGPVSYGGYTVALDREGPAMPWHDRHGVSVRIPSIPLWQGVAINSAAWALLPAIPLVARPLARRTKRARQGLCSRCMYPRNDADHCPECGHRHRGRAR